MNSKSTPSNTGRPSIKGRLLVTIAIAIALVLGFASPLLSPSSPGSPADAQAIASVVIEDDSRTDVDATLVSNKAAEAVYIIQDGDTYDSIAARHGVASDKLQARNGYLVHALPVGKPMYLTVSAASPQVQLVVNSSPTSKKDKKNKGTKWDRLAECESTSNWSIASGNGYYGGLQFSLRTWKAFGGKGMPNKASRSQQIAVAERVLKVQGWKAWPACSRKLGLR